MAQIFISHAGANNAEAAALGQWLEREDWGYFLDINDHFVPGESWISALLRESERCELVLLILSKAWQGSSFCFAEHLVAKALGKRVLGVLIDPLDESKGSTFDAVQRCDLTGQEDVEVFHVVHPKVPATDVPFPRAGLSALAQGLRRMDVNPTIFPLDPNANPYPGLKAFDEKEAAVFFGRSDELSEVQDYLLRNRTRHGAQLFVINGASGVGKSSFLRAGLLSRLKRLPSNFIVLPVIRPGRAAITGNSGLMASLQLALEEQGCESTRQDLEGEVSRTGLAGVLHKLLSGGSSRGQQRTIVISVDQAEELSEVDATQESRQLTQLLGDIPQDSTPVIVLMTTRLESMAAIDVDRVLANLHLQEKRLRPIPPWKLKEAIERPALLYKKVAERPIEIKPKVVDALLADAQRQPDALPLMALVLNQLFEQAINASAREIDLKEYESFGGIRGAIDGIVRSALVDAKAYRSTTTEHAKADPLLLETIFPLLSTYDVETKQWKRRIAPAQAVAKLPPQARALVSRLINERLLVADGSQVEPAHEAVMRHWTAWSRWQEASIKDMTTIERAHRTAIDWKNGEHRKSLLVHTGHERKAVACLQRNNAFENRFDPDDLSYLRHCRRRDFGKQARLWAAILTAVPVLWSLWWTRQNDFDSPLDYAVLPFKWTAAKALQLGNQHIPPTVELRPGTFVMGCLAGRDDIEGAECQPGDAATVRIDAPCAMGTREVTFLEYDYYVWSSRPADSPDGRVPSYPDSSGFGRMDRPVINVTWNNAQDYVRWLSNRTDQEWRLPTEKEWEYAARGGVADEAFPWGKKEVEGWANCARCDDKFGGQRTAPVTHYEPNGFGIYDTVGNVAEWVADKASEEGTYRVLRGGSWLSDFKEVRTASRSEAKETHRDKIVGFRVCRDLPDTSGQAQAGGSAKEAKP